MHDGDDRDAELRALRLLAQELEAENERLRRSLERREGLSGILTICAGCNMFRAANEDWVRLEAFLSDRLDVAFSHSLCPGCAPGFGLPDD